MAGVLKERPFADGLTGAVSPLLAASSEFARQLRAKATQSRRLVHRTRGIKPGTPVPITGLNRTFVVMPHISRMASSGSAEMSKFS